MNESGGGRPVSRARHMMDCRVRRREIEGEKRGEGMEGRLFKEGRLGGTEGWGEEMKDVKENVRRKVSEMGG